MGKNKFILLVLITVLSTASYAQYNLEVAFPNLSFSNALYLTHAGDGSDRIFVVERSGRIKVFENSQSVSTVKTFLDITDRVSAGGEMGLLGLAFHPDYEKTGFFYVNYTAGNPRRTIISRFQVSPTNPDSADKNSEFELLNFNQPFGNHNGGWIGFRQTDGYLYIGTGDGGSGGDPQNNGQKLTTMLGKILRIDVDNQDPGLNYAIPQDNPFVDSTGNVVKEIYAWGLRNPWRCSFDPATNFFWAADVGQNAWEEIDIIESGKNYGWRCYEGTHPYNLSGCNYPEYIDPVWEYDHPTGFSITGGYVYRGQNVPELNGKYIYGDYVTKLIWALTYDGVNPPSNEFLLTAVGDITSFGIDQNDELYITSFNGNIYRFTPTGILNAPTNLDGFASITLGVPPIIVVDLNWIDNSNNEDGFVLERKIANGSFEVIDSVSANEEAYRDRDLADSATYTYRIAAFNSSNFSAYSNEFVVITPVRLTAPTNLVATTNNTTQVAVTWQDNEFQEDGYKIERKTGFAGTYSIIDSVSTNVTLYNDNSVSPNNIYYYRAFAYLVNVNSFYSNEDSANTSSPNNVGNLPLPGEYFISQNYPNPFNPSTVIKYSLPEESSVKITIYNSLGKEIGILAEDTLQAGHYEKVWNANYFSSGIYFVGIKAESVISDRKFTNVIKMLFLK